MFEYDVSINPTPNGPKRIIKRRIFQIAEGTSDWAQFGLLGTVAHDHSSKLISSRSLPQPLVITVSYFDEDEDGPQPNGKQYTLTFDFARKIDTASLIEHLNGNPQYRDYDITPTISALNIIMAAHPNRAGGPGVMIGRNRFFFPTGTSFPLGGGLEAWKGYYSSVRPTHRQLMVNVNTCATAFYVPGDLFTAIVNADKSFGPRASAFVKNVRVKTTHLHHRKTVKGITNVTAENYRFEVQEYGNEEMSVEQYFKRKYDIVLRYPKYPLVELAGMKNYMPAELCEILPGQPFQGELGSENTAQMIKFAAKPPNINAQAIVSDGLSLLGFTPRGSTQLQAFDINVGNEMTVVPARILSPPALEYRTGKLQSEKASWNLRNVKFHSGGNMSGWAILVLRDGNQYDFLGPNDPYLKTVYEGFKKMCVQSGMTADNKPPHVICIDLPRKDPSDRIRSAAIAAIEAGIRARMKSKFPIMLVMLSNDDSHIYSGLKYLCDVILDIPTVCAHSEKIKKEKGQLQYFGNVALKFNMKLGGVNHQLDENSMKWFRAMPTMLVGIDVTHPGPHSMKGTPSIAAVVASCDDKFGQYPASMEMQKSKKEMVSRLDVMMQERLKFYQLKNNKALPQRVLVYRDGVSEGQFATVVHDELPLIKEAFKNFDTAQKQYRPLLTIVICGKRHHTRFYPTESADADANGNPLPGTVVDRGVTAIYNFDFFLQAHAIIQGQSTARPTHYYVVHDEIGFTADSLQGLTHSLSYMFARATKGVSLAPPAYYADIACERGRCYIHELLVAPARNLTEEQVVKRAKELWKNGVSGAQLKNTMFYL